MLRLLAAGLLVSSPVLGQGSRPFPMEVRELDAARSEVRLQPRLDAIRDLLPLDAVRLTGLVLPGGEVVDLDLERIRVDRLRIGLLVDGEPRPDLLANVDLSLWKGTVAGEPGSTVMLSFSNSGSSGWIQRADALVHVMPRPDAAGSWVDGDVLLTTEAELNARGMRLEHGCEARRAPGEELAPALPPTVGDPHGPVAGGACTLRECSIAIESDYQLYQVFNDLNAMTSYVTTLLGFVNDRYETQANTTLTFPYVQFYTSSNDPWSSQDSGGDCVDVLMEFQNAWVGNIPAGARIGHLLSGANLGCGVAWVDVLCNDEFNFSVSGNLNGDVQFPVVQQPNNWDFIVIAHELGHNFGAFHSHDYCPPLDECPASQYWGDCQDEQICLTDGTIMSYCHLCPGGTANITTFFHTTISGIITGRAEDCLPLAGGGIALQSPPALLAPGIATQVTADVTGSPIGSVELLYRYQGGGFSAVAMSDQGGGQYTADLPPAGCDDTPEYYVAYTDADCGFTTDPQGAPGTVYTAEVGTLTTAFADDFEANLGWTVQNLGATSGDWERGVPVDDGGWQYDPAADHDGSGQCFLTENQDGNTDVDGGSTRLSSPVIDMSQGSAFITYAYFLRLTDDDGTDRLLVEISSNGGAGPWTEIASHDTDGGLQWRTHAITSSDLANAGVTQTANMQMRFTANDGNPQSIVEAGLDAFEVSTLACDDDDSLGKAFCSPAELNSTGFPGEIAGSGSELVGDDDVTVEAVQLPSGEPAVLLVSPTGGGAATIPGGRVGLCIGAPFAPDRSTATTVGGGGSASFAVDLTGVPTWTGPVAVQPGETWYFQVLYGDGGAQRFTDALRVKFQ